MACLGGRLVGQGGQELRQYGSGVLKCFIGGLYKVNKNQFAVTYNLQTYDYKQPNYKTLRTAETTNCRIQNCRHAN